jgi:hypothetical protein
VATLVFGGVLDRHPKLDVWISHGGGALPVMVGRLAQAAMKRPWASAAHKKDGAFEALVSRLWFDTHVTDERLRDLLRQIADNDRLVFGTNFAGWDQSNWGGDHAVVDPAFADNARRLGCARSCSAQPPTVHQLASIRSPFRSHCRHSLSSRRRRWCGSRQQRADSSAPGC